MLKNIFARIWAFWGIVSFITTFFIFYIPSMLTWLLPDPAGQRIFIGIARIWMRIWLTLVGCPFKIKGRKYFEKGKSYVVTCNHNSLMDVPLSSPFIPGANKTIAKSSFTKVPLFGFYYMKGAVLVKRKDEKSRKESFEKMKEVLRKGMHMCVYPEGTRNRTSEPLKNFYDGAFKLAVASGASIIPAIIFNTKRSLPLNKTFYFLPTKLEMHFLEPIPTGTKTAEELKQEVFAVMHKYYTTNSRQ
ncbi:MAG: 1-acyl-sn-glycerol-3-phosphate acyltransferase [Chitinophagaceae bacterium]